jgi:two-component system, NtrC family, sensor kinase
MAAMDAEDSNISIDDLLRLLLQQSSETALILLNPAGRIVGWFRAAQSVFGYSSEEVLGKRHSVLFTPEEIQKGGARI